MGRYDDLRFRLGVTSRQQKWRRELREQESKPVIDPSTLPRKGAPEPAPVGNTGSSASMQGVTMQVLENILEQIVSRIPRDLRQQVNIQRHPGQAVHASLRGEAFDVVPSNAEIALSFRPDTLQIVARVAYEDGTMDPRNYSTNYEDFAIDWTSPFEDLVGLVSRYFQGRKGGPYR